MTVPVKVSMKKAQETTRATIIARRFPRPVPPRGEGSGCSHVDAGALEIAVEMALAGLVANAEEPAVAAFRIGQDLPAIVVDIPEIEAVGAVLEDRHADLGELPLLGLLHNRLVRRVDLLLGLDVEAVMVEEAHLAGLLGLHHGDDVIAAEPDEQRDLAGLHHVEAEELLIEFAREINIVRIERAVRKEVQLERRLNLGRRVDGLLCGRHRRLHYHHSCWESLLRAARPGQASALSAAHPDFAAHD